MKSTATSVVGQRFDRLVVTGEPFSEMVGQSRRWFATCHCDCGQVDAFQIKKSTGRPQAQSCGCLRAANVRKKNTSHGHTTVAQRKRGYSSWQSMRTRCGNPNHPRFSRYGGRGIRVCQRWNDSFEAFIEDMGERPSPRHSIERKDNNRGYEPGNCFWATSREQASNRCNNRMLEMNGESRTVTEWSRLTGVGSSTIRERLRRGWTVARAIGLEVSISQQINSR